MYKLQYACRLETNSTDRWESVLRKYSTWIESYYIRKHAGHDISLDLSNPALSIPSLPSEHDLTVERHSYADNFVTKFMWRTPHDRDKHLIIRNEVAVGKLTDRLSIEHRIASESNAQILAPMPLIIGTPNIIRDICRSERMRVDTDEVTTQVTYVSESDIAAFVARLEARTRRLPIVFLSPLTSGQANAIEATRCADRLLGLAHVFVAADPDATWEMAEHLGRRLSCYDGAARIYWPLLSKGDDPYSHPLYLADRIEQVGPARILREIEDVIFQISTLRFAPDPGIADVIDLAEQAMDRADLERQVAEGVKGWEELALEFEAKHKSSLVTIKKLEAEIAELKASRNIIVSSGAADQHQSMHERDKGNPKTAADAVEMAKKKSSRLIFLQSAVDSAMASPFRGVEKLMMALEKMDEVAGKIKENGMDQHGGRLDTMLRNHITAKRISLHISDTTRHAYGDDYKFMWGNEERMFEPHITLGSGDPTACLSIHFNWDPDEHRFIVAYVGRHLRNTKT